MRFSFKKRLKRCYWDTAAATPLDKRVQKTMDKNLVTFGNSASFHSEGVEAKRIVTLAREKIARILFCQSDEIIFTGSGTESNNLAILGTALACGRGHIITTQIEHRSVLAPCEHLACQGFDVTYLPVNKNGLVDLLDLERALRPETFLISIVYANNEIGSIQPIKELAKVIRQWRKKQTAEDSKIGRSDKRLKPYFHLDACQAPRFLNLNVAQLGVDMMTLNGSKIYGPKGAGLLYVGRGVELKPVILGGGQENGLRSGTQNTLAIVGLAKALEICLIEQGKESESLFKVQEFLVEELKKIPGVSLNGGFVPGERLPNNLNFSVYGLEGEQLVLEFDAKGFSLSTGSACSSSKKDGSFVIKALGLDQDRQNGAVRISLPREVKMVEAKKFVKKLKEILAKYRLLAKV